MTDPAPDRDLRPEHDDPDGPNFATRDEDENPLTLVGEDLADEDDAE